MCFPMKKSFRFSLARSPSLSTFTTVVQEIGYLMVNDILFRQANGEHQQQQWNAAANENVELRFINIHPSLRGWCDGSGGRWFGWVEKLPLWFWDLLGAVRDWFQAASEQYVAGKLNWACWSACSRDESWNFHPRTCSGRLSQAEHNEFVAFHHSAVSESIVLGSCARSIHDLNNKGSGNENYFRLTELFIRAIA